MSSTPNKPKRGRPKLVARSKKLHRIATTLTKEEMRGFRLYLAGLDEPSIAIALRKLIREAAAKTEEVGGV